MVAHGNIETRDAGPRLMQRWQRHMHLWLWLVLAAVVATVLSKVIENQSELAATVETEHTH